MPSRDDDLEQIDLLLPSSTGAERTRDGLAMRRILPWALVGAFGGFLVGFFMSSYTCHDGLIYNCYPTQEFKIGLLTGAGLLAGLLAPRLRRSMTDRRETLMTRAILTLLVVLVVACFARINYWSCPKNADCFNAPGGPFATT